MRLIMLYKASSSSHHHHHYDLILRYISLGLLFLFFLEIYIEHA